MKMTTQKSRLTALTLIAGAAALSGAIALAATSSKLILNGRVASNNVRVINGTPYVKLADVAKSMGMVVVKRGTSYEIKKAGGATPIKGVTQGLMGDVLFDGRWRFQVQSFLTPASYTLRTDAQPYNEQGISYNQTTHVLMPKPGYTLAVLQCKVTNGQNSPQRLWTALGREEVHNAVTDEQGSSYPPITYDFEGAPIQTKFLLPGASLTFPIFFSVPNGTQIKDLVFTLKNNSGVGTANDVRVKLPQ